MNLPRVSDGLVEVVVAEDLQRPVRQQAEAGGVELDATMLDLVHAQRPLQPELGRIREVGLEGRRGDGLHDAGRALGLGEGTNLWASAISQ